MNTSGGFSETDYAMEARPVPISLKEWVKGGALGVEKLKSPPADSETARRLPHGTYVRPVSQELQEKRRSNSENQRNKKNQPRPTESARPENERASEENQRSVVLENENV